MYRAVSYIGERYVPGELIDEDMPQSRIEWLLKAGAIEPIAPAAARPEVETPQEPEQPDEPPQPQEDAAAEDEIDEDDEAPEIDVMAGLVSRGEDEEKPKPKRGKRK